MAGQEKENKMPSADSCVVNLFPSRLVSGPPSNLEEHTAGAQEDRQGGQAGPRQGGRREGEGGRGGLEEEAGRIVDNEGK